jgi:hypothetical protein
VASCPYQDQHEMCEVTLHECMRTAHNSCPDYWNERRRIRTALSECPLSRQRRGERRAWCRAGEEPVECFGWPEDCPKYWQHRALRAERGEIVCTKCGHTVRDGQGAVPVREVVGAEAIGLPGAEVQAVQAGHHRTRPRPADRVPMKEQV